MSESRVKNTLLSTFLNIFEQIVYMIFGLVVPRLIIKTFGSDVNGLTAFITQILNIFSLLQAGTVGASIFALYEPLAKKNFEQVNVIVDASTKFFRKVGCVFFALVLIILPFIVQKESSTRFSNWEIVATTLIMGLNGTLTFFFTARYDIVISSYQKRYILSIANILNKCIYYALVLGVIYLRKHFVLMYVSTLFANVIAVVFLHFNYKKLTKDWIKPLHEKNVYKIKNRTYLLCNQVVYQIINSLPLILIGNFYDLNVASIFSINYTLVNLLKSVILAFMHSVTEPFGNYNVLNKKQDVVKMYQMINMIISFVIIVFASCFICLSTNFIKLYTDNISSVNYVVPFLSISLTCEFFSYSHKLLSDILIDINGLYKNIYIPVITVGLVTVLLMILVVLNFGYEFLPFCSAIFYMILYVIFLFVIDKNLKIKLYKNYILLFSSLLLIFVNYYFYTKIGMNASSFFKWVLFGIFIFIISSIEGILLMLVFDKNIFFEIKKKVKSIIIRGNFNGSNA